MPGKSARRRRRRARQGIDRGVRCAIELRLAVIASFIDLEFLDEASARLDYLERIVGRDDVDCKRMRLLMEFLVN